MSVFQFIKTWTLPISMIVGVLMYFIYVNIPFLVPTKPYVATFISYFQPFLIFLMLFVSFCKVAPRDLHLCRWHLWLILFQIAAFSLLSLFLILLPDFQGRVIVESAMICFICPTATASAVITSKLNGNVANLTSYIILMNLATAIVAPLILPIVHHVDGISFFPAFCMIIAKVFPLLICPFLAAWLVRVFLPKLHQRILACPDLAFYLWAVALAIAIAVTVKSIVHSNVDFIYMFGIALASLVCCIVQFALGKFVGAKYDDKISAGQSLGQKNTVFAIWLGYTFLSPVTSVAGGFYSVWHNIFNSYQLYRAQKNQ